MLDISQVYNINFLEEGMLSVIPEAIVIIFAFIVLFLTFFEKLSKSDNPYYLSLISIGFSMLYILMLSGRTIDGFYGSIVFNRFSVFLFIGILFSGFLTILMSKNYIDNFEVPLPEYYSLILFGVASMMLLVSSNNLIMVFLSIEFMSITAYILTGYLKGNLRSTEAALKYFVLGTFASAFLIFGSVFIYAATGHLNLYNIHFFIVNIASKGLVNFGDIKIYLAIGLILFLVGLAFKMSLFPFHSWTPDAYDGAPTPVTNFMATGVKIAAFAIFLRIFSLIYNFNIMDFNNILWMLAILSMSFGNIAALMSSNIKRLLAYSSIAQAGYILVGIIGGGYYGYSGTLFYLLAYVFMTAGAFAVVIIFENFDLMSLDIKKYSGIGYKYPIVAAAMTFFLLSLAGIPVTSGFMGKFYVFSAAIKSRYNLLVLIAFINSAFAAFYYIKIIVRMYMPDKEELIASLNGVQRGGMSGGSDQGKPSGDFGIVNGKINEELMIVIFICLFFTLLMGIYPQLFINFAHNSISSLWNI
ncbi:MAG: NADH-quinone oxidoreductase subunit N [Deltaproteobacteria bacterium]|jgi:NADH-quinone oxidoreductase subunit N|nr:NADH-quinone oxidoreductase subunit N [Deltaproteobacteria bacterium]MCL5879454.1 NADH-quinone oxidoreductase subunit N [Deltaproteobacteria bacterium]MDA8304468.1 NADH-quinone oxidoreductase subunit N [Deltaproteobacteria bacterium]